MTPAADVSTLSRENLAGRVLVRLQRGSWSAPDVLLVEAGDVRCVVKDYAPRSRWLRATWGAWISRREERALAQLAGHPAVPGVLGRLDAWALVVEHRGGARFSKRRPWTFDARFGRRLAEAVRGLHARGVVHLDLRHRSNLRADLEGRPVLVDFGSALAFRPGGAGARWLLPWLALLDRYAVWKWRRRLAPARSQSAGDSGSEAGAASEGARGASRPT